VAENIKTVRSRRVSTSTLVTVTVPSAVEAKVTSDATSMMKKKLKLNLNAMLD